jgi:hypothetical protein
LINKAGNDKWGWEWTRLEPGEIQAAKHFFAWVWIVLTSSVSLNAISSQIGQEEEAESDIFSIKEVSFQATGDSEWKDTNYTLNTDSLDWVSAE